tara:strand:+ start:1086 stop:1316 length:231 start_codon:yes stop_codon:yes gene_type:complete
MVSVDFKIVGDDRGAYYEESERALIFLSKHESLDDIYKTITHELIHHCINKFNLTLDEDQEESLIFQMSWAEFSLN